ncbi:MAG: GGDEF domain-containing protein [Mariprofundaceae bacterium]|nr:GGDEF domain-containing protein [Mariprofundaceae bacterium]
MKEESEHISRVLILGGGRGGTAMLEMLCDEPLANVIAVVDIDSQATGIIQAKSLGIAVYTNVKEAIVACAPSLIFNLSHSKTAEKEAYATLNTGSIIGGIEAKLIWRMVTQLKNAKKGLEYQANHDLLTGLYNRRFMMEQMYREVNQAARYNTDCSLVLIDLDNFKRINDTYGHPVGDIVLQKVSDELQKSIRITDTLGRWGGEEFIVLLPHTNAHDAQIAAQLWLQRVLSISIDLAHEEKLTTSFSAGVAALKITDRKQTQEHIEILLEQVDHCLYKAKDAGRACIMGMDKEKE